MRIKSAKVTASFTSFTLMEAKKEYFNIEWINVLKLLRCNRSFCVCENDVGVVEDLRNT